MTPATDAEVAALKRLVAKGYYGSPNLPPLIARIEADGERMRAMEKVCEAAKGGCCNEEIDHDCDVRADCAWGAVCAALAALKEAPDA